MKGVYMKVVLTIAGSDSSGGAGIQADLKTFEAFNVFGTSALTVLTAQNTKGVTDISTIEPQFVKQQLDAIFDDFDVAAIKIGMLFSNEIIDVVRESIKDLTIPIVFDPVFISKAGSKLLNDDAIENMKSILPLCTVTTPNLFEAKELFNYDPANIKSKDVINSQNCAVLIKTHVLESGEETKSIDRLFINNKEVDFETKYEPSENTHGTGCSFSSAITANLALGKDLETAISISKKFVHNAIVNGPSIGGGKRPIAHKVGGELCH
jgi:hydroxymethylpyrimidine/phosphomethylpyrimidine kinase